MIRENSSGDSHRLFAQYCLSLVPILVDKKSTAADFCCVITSVVHSWCSGSNGVKSLFLPVQNANANLSIPKGRCYPSFKVYDRKCSCSVYCSPHPVVLKPYPRRLERDESTTIRAVGRWPSCNCQNNPGM